MNPSSTERHLYEEIYAGLNARQKEAVDRIQGQVLVVAGPGTGKTQILAVRIGKILMETDADADNILCLTYTEAGTVAMRQRLIRFLGADAYRVHVHTFHAFCNKVIQDNLYRFGMRELEPVSELERAEILRELIDDLPEGHILKKYTGDVYSPAARLEKLFETMKKELWKPAYMIRKTAEYLESLPFRDEYRYKRKTKENKVGDLKTGEIEKETQRMQETIAAVGLFELYEQKMRVRGRYDFDDMIEWVIDAFESDPDLLADYQERFQYILADEYQDTNGSQNRIISLLTDYEDPNVFVVGDDDQSIYRFQGANVGNIIDFHNTHKNGIFTVVLETNYRSTQEIVNLSNDLISRNNERITGIIPGLEKNLYAAKGGGKFPVPKVHVFPNPAHESLAIAEEIGQRIRDGEDPDSIAVLYKRHAYVEDLFRVLREKEIPVVMKKEADLLYAPFILQVINLLRYIDVERRSPFSGDGLLFEIMHDAWFGISPIETAKLMLSLRRSGEKANSLREKIANISSAPPDLFSDVTPANPVTRFSMLIESLIRDAGARTLHQLFEEIITRGGILDFVMQSPDKIDRIQELNAFYGFMKDETRRNTHTTLGDFLLTIDMMLKSGLRLPAVRSTFREQGVHLLTLHSAKGLEFDTVYIIGNNEKEWAAGGKNSNFKLPDNLITKTHENQEEESRRLLYVGMTRARKNLVLSYTSLDRKNKEIEATRYMQEIVEKQLATKHERHLDNDTLTSLLSKTLQTVALPDENIVEWDFVELVLQNYRLSVTHLNDFLHCPLSFYYKHILRVPSTKSASMEFGSAVHYALEYAFRSMTNDAGHAFPPMGEIMHYFTDYMERHKDAFTDHEYALRMTYAEKILPRYFEKYMPAWNRVVSVEKNISCVCGEVPVRGKLDKIEFDGNNAVVVDYKTGRRDYAVKKLAPPQENATPESDFGKRYGGDYWRQAVFYKILVREDPSQHWNVVATEFDFVEPDTKSGVFYKDRVPITESDISIVKDQMRDVYARILKHDFYQGCAEPDCAWCNFVRSRYMEAPEPGGEDMEDENNL